MPFNIPSHLSAGNSYKKVKDLKSVTGNGRQTCKFSEKLDAILGHPASTLPVLLDAGSSAIPYTELQSLEPDVSGTETDGRDGM